MFRDNWYKAVGDSGSVLCAGLDPAEFGMCRGEKGLPEGINKRLWAKKYVEAVLPHCAAVKPNLQYWKSPGRLATGKKGDLEFLRDLPDFVDAEHESGAARVIIDDSKLADIGSTNDAGIFYSACRADAVTFSPFAGNIAEAAEQARDRKIGLISMVLMSNPEYERQKNKLVGVTDEEYGKLEEVLPGQEFKEVDGKLHVRQYIELAYAAKENGVDAIVIGAPSKKNHISEEEIAIVRNIVGPYMLVLLPGVGAQGGEADIIWKYFGADNVIVNVGRSLMLPKGSDSTKRDQAEAAKRFNGMLNDLRGA